MAAGSGLGAIWTEADGAAMWAIRAAHLEIRAGAGSAAPEFNAA